MVKKAEIIILNGTSSSGKTSLAKALQNLLDPTYLYLALDTFGDMFPDHYLDVENEDLAAARKNNVLSIMLNYIKFFASSENDLIIDHVLDESSYLLTLVKELSEFNLIFIGVHCPLHVLEKRENIRGDRKIGLARSQYENVHKGINYNFEVDTSQSLPIECALKIIEYLKNDSLFYNTQ